MFKLEGILNKSAFLELTRQLEGYNFSDNANKEVIIDLSKITFSEPFGIVGLIIFTRHLYNGLGFRSKIILPKNSDARGYIITAGIHIDEGKITRFQRDDNAIAIRLMLSNWGLSSYGFSNTNFIPVTSITSINDIIQITSEVDTWMRDNNYSNEKRLDVQVLVSELCQNIIHHSDTVQNGVFLMQGYTRKIRDNTKYCIVSIGDSGIGIKNSLSKNPKYRGALIDDRWAINYALNKGWSSKENERFRGNGFANLLRLSEKHSLNISIHSHSGFLSYTYPDSPIKKPSKSLDLIYPVIGTQVSFELKTKLR